MIYTFEIAHIVHTHTVTINIHTQTATIQTHTATTHTRARTWYRIHEHYHCVQLFAELNNFVQITYSYSTNSRCFGCFLLLTRCDITAFNLSNGYIHLLCILPILSIVSDSWSRRCVVITLNETGNSRSMSAPANLPSLFSISLLCML